MTSAHYQTDQDVQTFVEQLAAGARRLPPEYLVGGLYIGLLKADHTHSGSRPSEAPRGASLQTGRSSERERPLSGQDVASEFVDLGPGDQQ